MTLWDKGEATDKDVEAYTVGNDPKLDQALVPYDCTASQAHAKTLAKAGLLTEEEAEALVKELEHVKELHGKGEFGIEQSQEDCHTAIEEHLTKKLGDTGKKIHAGRSRNDQVLAALRLYEKDQIEEVKGFQEAFMEALQVQMEKHAETAMPGYTHTQKAMPTTAAAWLGAFHSAGEDNLKLLDAAKTLIDQSPLGSAAGYGTANLELDNDFTAEEAGFAKAMEPATYAQHTRGKFESTILHALTQVTHDLNKLATDLVLYATPQFGYVKLPSKHCTGSSIMPQKKNPDVLELARAKHHLVLAEESKLKGLTSNLISGYHRDLQLTKEPVMNGLSTTKQSLAIMTAVVKGMELDTEACAAAMTPELHATEEAYELIKQGVPFREAYKNVGKKHT